MTTYTAIPNGDVDSDSPITTSLITKLRDNPIAITEGSSGAPQVQTAGIANSAITSAKIAASTIVNSDISGSAAIATSKLASDNGITQSMLAANSVGQSEIKTAVQTRSSGGAFTATGGIYVIGHLCENTNSGVGHILKRGAPQNEAAGIALWDWDTVSSTNDNLNLYYINSSPPYDLGDGEIPLFLYLRVAANGDIINIDGAVDPCWAYNGPTNWADRKAGNKLHVKDTTLVNHTFDEAKALGGAAISEYLAQMREAPMMEVELTQDIKNADMNIVPKPMPDQPGNTIVLLDPQSPVVAELAEIHAAGEKYSDIIRNYIEIDNTGLNRGGPQSLMQVGCRWKTNL